MNRKLWGVQTVLAIAFLSHGGSNSAMPADELATEFPLPVVFMQLVGAAEVLGALGLVLPGLLRSRPGLTPLAAAGLTIIMVGAVTITVAGGAVVAALFPLAVGLLTALVAYGRWQPAPRRVSSRRAALRPAV